MAYSYTTYSGDGSTTTFSYGGIPLISDSIIAVQSQIVVTVDGVAVAYTVSGTDVVLGSAPAAGSVVVVARDTKDDDRYVDWTNTSQLDASSLNLDSDQIFFLAQEAKELADTAVQTTGGLLDAKAGRIINVASATQPTDAVNLAQLDAKLGGGVVSEFSGQGLFSAIGDNDSFTNGVTYELPGLAGRTAQDINVFTNGFRSAHTAYTVADFGQNLRVTFPSGVIFPTMAVEIVWSTGIVSALVDPTLIQWDQIDDDVIPVAALDVAPADDGKFLTVSGGLPSFDDITVSDVTDFDSSVRSYSLSDFDALTGNLSMNNNRLTDVTDALVGSDAPNWAQVQLLVASSGGGGTSIGGQGPQGPAGPQGPEGPQGPAGADGADGADGSDGVDGNGWTGGSYDASTGVVTFTSDDGLGFSTGDLRGADGADGSGGGATGTSSANMILKLNQEVLVGQAPDGKPMYSYTQEFPDSVLSGSGDLPIWDESASGLAGEATTGVTAEIIIYVLDSNGDRRAGDASSGYFVKGRADGIWYLQRGATGDLAQVQMFYTKDSDSPVTLVPASEFSQVSQSIAPTNIMKAGQEVLIGQAPDGKPLYSYTTLDTGVSLGNNSTIYTGGADGTTTVSVDLGYIVNGSQRFFQESGTSIYLKEATATGNITLMTNLTASEILWTRYYTKDSDSAVALVTADEFANVTLPTGGTTGQALVKVDGTDGNVEWASVSGGGGSTSYAQAYGNMQNGTTPMPRYVNNSGVAQPYQNLDIDFNNPGMLSSGFTINSDGILVLTDMVVKVDWEFAYNTVSSEADHEVFGRLTLDGAVVGIETLQYNRSTTNDRSGASIGGTHIMSVTAGQKISAEVAASRQVVAANITKWQHSMSIISL